MHDAILTLYADEDEETIDKDSRELSRLISMETRTETEIVEGETIADERGGSVTIGQIALAFLTGGSAVALLDVLRPWFDRRQQGKIDIKLIDGTSIIIESDDFHDGRYDAIVEKVDKLLEKAAR